MYITVDNAYQFEQAFRQCGRVDQFSYEGLRLLFEYLEEADPQWELDVIALCCEYSEENPEGIAKNYDFDLEGCETEADIAAAVLDYLHNETSVVGVTTSGEIIYQQF